MRTMLSTVLFVTSIVACGNAAAPNDPSAPPGAAPASTSTANIPQSTTGGPSSPGDPSGVMPSNNAGATSLSGAPASPVEGKCKSGEPGPTAKDLDSCLKTCQGLDDQVPLGSKCISAKTSCTSQCNTKYKKP